MSDTDEQRKTGTGNPLVDLPVTPQGTQEAMTAHEPKRLRDGELDVGALSQLLTYLAGIENTNPIAVPFSSIFERSNAGTLKYTENSAWEGEYPPDHLFRSDVALLFYDLLVKLNLTDDKVLTEIFEEISPNNSGTLGRLIDVVKNYSSSAGKTMLYEDEERRLTELFSTGSIHVASRFFLNYLQREKKEEEKVEGEGGGSGAGAAKPGELPTAAVPLTTPTTSQTTTGEGGATDAAQPTEPGTAPQSTTTSTPAVDVLEIKRQLFSPEIREQAARFTQISLYQLERFHNLPEGSLQNSREIREILSQKSMSFFATVLTEGKLNDLVNAPELRAGFVQKFLWDTQNDFRATAAITKHLSEVVLKNADPATRQQIEAELLKAEKGENVSELISNLVNDPQVESVLKEIKKASPAFLAESDAYLGELGKELNQHLKDIGTQGDRVVLAKANVENIVDAMISMGMSPEVLKYIDEKRFRTIFGDDIPYNANFVQEFLPEYWEARRATLGKKYGTLVLEGESRFALDEALQILDKNNQLGVTEAQSDEAFNRAIAAPINDVLVPHRELGVSVEKTLEAAYSRDFSVLRERYESYLRARWEAFSLEKRAQVLSHFGYGETTSQEVMNLSASVEFYPPQLGILELSPIAGNYIQGPGEFQTGGDFIPAGANIRSTLGGVRGLLDQVNQWRGLPGLAQSIGGPEGEKAIAELAGQLAGKAASGLPGGPVTGKFAEWLAKNAATKEGRKKIIIGAGAVGGILGYILGSIGGGIGAGIGAAIGWFAGGPVGAAVGGFFGGATGWGIEQWIRNALGGGGAGNEGSGFTAGGGWTSGGGGGGGSVFAGAAPALEGAAAATATIGGQAVLGALGGVAIGTMLTTMIVNNALLADFPISDPFQTLVPGTQGKPSEYVTVEKRAFIEGCPNNKCEDPKFPVRAEYSIIIRPKDDYSITLKEVTDTLSVHHSADSWEEDGKTPPNIDDRVRTITDFGDATCDGVPCSLSENQTIAAGTEFAFSYVEEFSEDYNHARILNTFEIKFAYSTPDTDRAGEDSAMTAEVLYIGNYDEGEGCWPATGTIVQMPFNRFAGPNSVLTHSVVDAYDISAPEGTYVYASFTGNACAYAMGEDNGLTDVYGNHVLLTTSDGKTLAYGHLRSTTIPVNTCKEIAMPSQVIGYVGNTGTSNPHLHFELRNQTNSWPSPLSLLMPDGVTIRNGQPVESCHDF